MFYKVVFGVVSLEICFVCCAQSDDQIIDSVLRSHSENQELIRRLETAHIEYEYVYPFQNRERVKVDTIETRNYQYPNESLHYHRATFIIRNSHLTGEKLKLQLHLNREIIPPAASYTFIANETHRQNSEVVENCYYQGEVNGDTDSFVALSTCVGLKGVIVFKNESYILHPLKGGDMTKRHPHILYKASSLSNEKGVCSNSGFAEWESTLDQKQRYIHHRKQKRDATQETKYVELAIVLDNYAMKSHNQSSSAALLHILDALNSVDLMYQTLNTRISLVYLEAWLESQQIHTSNKIAETLLDVIDYSALHFYSLQKDLLLFITTNRFKDQAVVMAASGAMCGAKSAGVIRNIYLYEPHKLAVLIAHALGHVVGMKHEEQNHGTHWGNFVSDPGCDCTDKNGCLMAEKALSRKSVFAHAFSSCSKNEFSKSLTDGHLRCLFNRPLKSDALLSCGNRIIDVGEQCDCGFVEECDSVDPCCDPNTCKFRQGASCSSGLCCDNCQPKPRGSQCRAASNECDAPEFCDGHSGQCPADAYKMNGVVCASGDSYCFAGRCTTANDQCQRLWGPSALNGHETCYRKAKIRGRVGFCGLSPDFEVPCESNDVFCGLLRCSGGNDAPKMRLEHVYASLFPNNSTIAVQCKSIVGKPEVSFAENGVKCGEDMVCIDRVCVLVSSVTPEPQCPTNNLALQCSGRGICTNLNTCFCNPGWTGVDCSERTLIQQTPDLFSTTSSTVNTATGSVNNKDKWLKDTYQILVILGGTVGVVFVLSLCCVLCYRRRTASVLHKKQKSLANGKFSSREFEKESESSVDTAGRSIKFGSMPSYKNEKRLKQNKARSAMSNGLRKILEQDERSHSSDHSAEQQKPLLTNSGQAPNCMPQANGYATARDGGSRDEEVLVSGNLPDRGILKNHVTLLSSTGPYGTRQQLQQFGRCYSDFDTSSRETTVTPLSSRKGNNSSLRSRNDCGYESDTCAASKIYQLQRLADFDVAAASDTQRMSCNASRCEIVDTSLELQEIWPNNGNESQPHLQACAGYLPSYASSSANSKTNLMMLSDASGRNPAFQMSTADSPQLKSQQSKYGQRVVNNDTSLHSKTSQNHCEQQLCSLNDTGSMQFNNRSHMMQQELKADKQQFAGNSSTDPDEEMSNAFAQRRRHLESPTSSVVSTTSAGRFFGKPTPLKLRNIELLLKQLEIPDELSPGSSTELSVPEADKAFLHLNDADSNTESNVAAVTDLFDDQNLSTVATPLSGSHLHRSYLQSKNLSSDSTGRSQLHHNTPEESSSAQWSADTNSKCLSNSSPCWDNSQHAVSRAYMPSQMHFNQTTAFPANYHNHHQAFLPAEGLANSKDPRTSPPKYQSAQGLQNDTPPSCYSNVQQRYSGDSMNSFYEGQSEPSSNFYTSPATGVTLNHSVHYRQD